MKKNILPLLAMLSFMISCSEKIENQEAPTPQPEKALRFTYTDVVDQLNKVFACDLYLAAEGNPVLQKEYLEKYFHNTAPTIDTRKRTITTNHYSTGMAIHTGNKRLTDEGSEWTVKLSPGGQTYTLRHTGNNLYTLKGRTETEISPIYTSLETDLDLRIKVETKDDIPYYPSHQKTPRPRITWVYTLNGNSTTTGGSSRLGYTEWTCEMVDLKAYDPKMHFGAEPVFPAKSYFRSGLVRMKLLRSLNGEAESATLSYPRP